MSSKTYSYSPISSYEKLKEVEVRLESAQNIDDIRNVLAKDGAKIGYKAFCYMLMRKMTPEAMKPDEAAINALKLQQQGEEQKAQEIYRRILASHPQHPLALQQINATNDDVPSWVLES